jgi:hypothetical protein
VPAADISGVELKGHVVPAAARIGQEGEGISLIQRALILSRSGIASFAAGVVMHARELACAYARERVLYGASILTLDPIAEHLLRMEALELAVITLTLKGAAMINARGQGAAFYTALSKFAACQLAEDAVTEGRRVFGAHGLVSSSPYERVIRDVIVFSVFDGTRHLMLDQIHRWLAAIAARSASSPAHPLEILRATYHAPPISLTVMARKRGRVLVLPIVEVAHALAAIPGETRLDLLVRLAESLISTTRQAIDTGRWESRALRFDLSEVLAFIETLSSLVELFDPDRRQTVAPPLLPPVSDRDRDLYRYAFGFIGASAASRLREVALSNDLTIDDRLLEAERVTLSGQASLRRRLIERIPSFLREEAERTR